MINILGCDQESEKHINISQFICETITHSRAFRQNDLAERGSNFTDDPLLTLLHSLEEVDVTKSLLDIILMNLTKESTVVSGIKIILKLLETPIM